VNDCDGCTRWGARYHELQQSLQRKLIEMNDKRIAAEERVKELEAEVRSLNENKQAAR